eukprot:777889_1
MMRHHNINTFLLLLTNISCFITIDMYREMHIIQTLHPMIVQLKVPKQALVWNARFDDQRFITHQFIIRMIINKIYLDRLSPSYKPFGLPPLAIDSDDTHHAAFCCPITKISAAPHTKL